jgi:Subtilisin inhibitor-like
MIAAACAGLVAACGSTAAPGGSAASPAPAPKVSLDIKVTGTGTTTKHWTLRCDPPGGTHPDPASACQVLLKASHPFAPVPKGIMCPMIIAGAKRAIVKGTYFGQHVDTTFTQGGCQLARWTKIGQIFN